MREDEGVEVVLFTKPGCGLCDEVKEILRDLTAVYPHHLTEVDISRDDALFQRYRYTIPVVHIAGQTLQAPLTRRQLERALAR